MKNLTVDTWGASTGSVMNTRSLDDALTLVSHHQRRWIVQYLRAVVGNEVTFDTLVEHLASKAAADSRPTDPDHEDVRVELRHNHLPKLVEHGLVEFDAEEGTVRYTPVAPVEMVLDGVPTELGVVST